MGFALPCFAAGPPVITGFHPAAAPTGGNVTVSGRNFDPTPSNNIVYFGAVRAAVTAASTNSLTTAVPPGATHAPITVTANGLSAWAGTPFLPTFAGNGTNLNAASFAPGFNLPAGIGPSAAALADLDGDGKPDLIEVNGGDHTVSVFRNVSAPGVLTSNSFAPRVDFPLPVGTKGGNPYKVTVADVDGDGKLDLIVSEAAASRVSIFRNVATPGSITLGSFAPPVSLATGADCRFARAVDLDGDGRTDIVALNYGANTISILRNIGAPGDLTTNSFAPKVDLSAPGGPYEVAIGDLDGDGKPDLAVATQDVPSISLFRNASASGTIDANSFDPPVVFLAPGYNDTVAIGDVDGDGKPDVIIGSVLPETMSVFRNLASPGSFSTNSLAPRVDFSTGYWTHTVALGDFNGDGKVDIAVVGELPSVMSVFQNLSAPGSFTSASLADRIDFSAGYNAWGVAAGDLDGDGRADLVFCNSYDHTLTVYHNVVPMNSPPVIVVQPTSQTVIRSNNATFAVTAIGTDPLAYQWRLRGTNLPGATSPSLTLTNAQFSDAGNYAVQVTNLFGSVLSSIATLTVTFPPASVQAGSTNAMGGIPCTIPLTLAANGNENSIGFSLIFDQALLAFESAAVGTGATGAAMLLDTNLVAAGELGIAVAFPTAATFLPGEQEFVQVTFSSRPVLGTAAVATTIGFGDQPLWRELSDSQLNTLSATYLQGTVTLLPTLFEADVWPRPNGNQTLSTTDWLQVGRFVARLDTPAPGSEFSRADCAPKGTLGDGQLKVTDWVQAGRHVAGLDPAVAMGGPTSETAPHLIGTSVSRQLRIGHTNATPGFAARVSVDFDAQGDENGLGFTFVFDPVEFTFAGAAPGSGAGGVNLTFNTNQVGAGQLGVLLALAPRGVFAAGMKELLNVSLVPLSPGLFPLTFTDQLVTRCVSDAAANELPVGYLAGSVTVSPLNPLPPLAIARMSNTVVLAWPAWAADFTLQKSDGGARFPRNWTDATGTVQTSGGQINVALPISSQAEFFRLRH